MAFGSESEDSGSLSEAKGLDVSLAGSLPVAKGSNISLAERSGKSTKKRLFCTVPGCDKSFSRPWRLEAHEFVHSGVAPFPCDVEGCDKRYTSKNHLTRHKKTAHMPAKSKLIECPFEGCKLLLKTNQNLKKHYKRAHVDKFCPECGKSFSKNIEFKYHMQYHTGNFMYSCEQCDLKFARKTEYGRHMRGHKIHLCPVKGCDFAFETWSLARKHLTTHQSPYVCYYCRKPYLNKGTFRLHVLTHLPDSKRKTVLKRFTCHYCEATVCGKQSLRRHMKNIHLNPRARKPPKKGPLRATRRDKGTPKLALSSLLSGLPCSSRMANILVVSNEPVFDSVVDIDESLMD